MGCGIIYILTILSVICRTTSIFNPQGPTVASEYTNCINKLIEANFVQSGLLMFGHTYNMSTTVSRVRAELLRLVHGYNKYFVEISNPVDQYETLDDDDDDDDVEYGMMEIFEAIPAANYYVIVIDTYTNFVNIAAKLMKARTWNPRAKFIIMLFKPAEKSDVNIRHAEKILGSLFKANVIRAVVVVPDSEDIRKALVYGWRPLDPPKYCGYLNETAKGRLKIVNTCTRGSVSQENKDLFTDVLPLDMKRCVIKILTLERQPFVSHNPKEISLEKEWIAQVLLVYNFTPQFDYGPETRGEVNKQGEWNGGLKDIQNKKADILLGAIFPDDDVHRDFDCSAIYWADSYTWTVPRADKSPAWYAIVITFDKLVWYSAIGGFFLCVLSWMVIGNLSGDKPYHRVFHHCFMNTLVSLVGWCAYSKPVTKSLRVFFGFFSLYCILFVTAYQTKLIDVLTNPSYEYQMQTVQEIIDSGMLFGGLEELQDLFDDSDDYEDQFINDIWVDVYDSKKAMVEVVVYHNFSLLCSRLELKYLTAMVPELSDSFGNYKYYELEQNVFTVGMEMVALKGYPFMDTFSKSLHIFQQAGIQEAVRSGFEAFIQRKRAGLLRSIDNDHPDVSSLSMFHLEGGFFVLLLGYVSGTVVLCIEIFINTAFFKENYVKVKKQLKCIAFK